MDRVEDVEAQYLSPLEKARLKNEQMNRKAREALAFIRFFQTSGYAIEPNQANEGILRSMFGESDIEITVSALDEVAQILSTREHNPLALRSPNRERQKHQELIDEICTEDPRIYGQSTHGQEVERKRLAFMSNDELSTRLQNVREEKRLRGMSIPELRAERAANKTAQPGFPTLPERFTAAIIKCMSAPQIRSLLSTYGEDAVNNRLAAIR